MAPTPFTIRIPDATLTDLRERLDRARWPDELPGAGWQYGADLTYLRQSEEPAAGPRHGTGGACARSADSLHCPFASSMLLCRHVSRQTCRVDHVIFFLTPSAP
jgi:Epoxide hydrolase N terminus